MIEPTHSGGPSIIYASIPENSFRSATQSVCEKPRFFRSPQVPAASSLSAHLPLTFLV